MLGADVLDWYFRNSVFDESVNYFRRCFRRDVVEKKYSVMIYNDINKSMQF